MRIRSIKPDYWDDERLHKTPGITADVREFYIGTWQLADDAGWLRWNVPEIGKVMYGYRGVAKRERDIREWSRRLADIGRLELLDCGHAFIPKLTKHQRLAGATRQVLTVKKEHETTCSRTSPQIPAPPRDSPPSRAPDGRERVPTERDVLEGEGAGGGIGGMTDDAITNLQMLSRSEHPEVAKAAKKTLIKMGVPLEIDEAASA